MNTSTLTIGNMAEEHYNKQSEGYGKQLNRQAKAQLEAWKGEERDEEQQELLEAFLAMPEDIDCGGFAEEGDGIEGMLSKAFDTTPLEHGGEPTGYDSLSDWEQHGILFLDGSRATYYAAETVTAEELDNGDGTYRYAGNGAYGDSKCVTKRPVSCAGKVAARVAEKPMTAGQMVREAHRLNVEVNNAQLQRFNRKFKGQQRTLSNLLAYVGK